MREEGEKTGEQGEKTGDEGAARGEEGGREEASSKSCLSMSSTFDPRGTSCRFRFNRYLSFSFQV